jgi:hypothetical protein
MNRPEARIVFTTENSRRISAWNQIAPSHEPESVRPKADEPAIRETDEIAKGKILSATDEIAIRPQDRFVSADALIFVGEQALKKPLDLTELRANFALIADHDGMYDIHSHTIVGEPQENNDLALSFSRFPLGARIQIAPEKALWLATQEGLQAYLTALNTLYDSQVPYTKIASGICVMTLVAMGVVESLEGVKLDLQDEESSLDVIYGTAYTAIINISPQALFAVAESFHSFERERTAEEVLMHERQLKKSVSYQKRSTKPTTLQKYSDTIGELQTKLELLKAQQLSESPSQESYWEKLRHHPYLEAIVAKVWETYSNRTLR